MNTEPIYKLEKINKSFSGVKVLNNVDLKLFKGEVHCLMGENGAGKSTLIKIISGSYTADNGTIYYQDNQYNAYSPRWAHNHGINAIYQEIDLVPHLSVAENISLGSEPTTKMKSIDKKAVRQKAINVFADMGIQIDVNEEVGKLTVAVQQLVAIARALSFNSKILILDEPTSVFTNKEIDLLFHLINKLKSQDIAILYISHHIEEIFKIGDRITILRDGNLIRTGMIHEFDKDSLIRAMVGRDVHISRKTSKEINAEEILKVVGLTRRGAVSDISFNLYKGEILGIGGLVGAGRTEMGRLIMGADKIEKGQIFYKGKQTKIKSPNNALKMGIGIVPEDRKGEGIIAERSVIENMAYSAIVKEEKRSIVPWKKIKEEVLQRFKSLNVQPQRPDKSIKLLSGGNQQKAVLGKILNADCDVLILDEPTRGVDVGAREEIYRVIQDFKNNGKSIIMISSDLIELISQSDRILVMAKGKIAGEIAGEEATEEKVLSLAFNFGGAEIVS